MVVEQEEDPRASAPTDAEADAAGERLRVQLEQHALMVDNQLVELQAAAAEQQGTPTHGPAFDFRVYCSRIARATSGPDSDHVCAIDSSSTSVGLRCSLRK